MAQKTRVTEYKCNQAVDALYNLIEADDYRKVVESAEITQDLQRAIDAVNTLAYLVAEQYT